MNIKYDNKYDDVLVAPDYDDADEIEYSEEEYHQYKDSTYEIISKVAYLIGVPKHIFENENQSPKLEVYEQIGRAHV